MTLPHGGIGISVRMDRLPPTLIYCAASSRRYAEIAIRRGFEYGAQLPHKANYPPYFTDQDWRKPNRARYMAMLAEYKPALATVLDWEREAQLPEVLAWADEASRHVTESVIIIPKVMGGISQLPDSLNGKPIRLGYSVPTSYGGTQLPLWEFGARPVHLLGGSPQKQMELARYLNVKSADGNYATRMARNNQFFASGSATFARNRYWPQIQDCYARQERKDLPYLAFELSCINIRAAWSGCQAFIRWAAETDLLAVKRIAQQYSEELGFVRLPALREALQKRELYIAQIGRQIVGFVNWHARRDGVQTIYEIAVHRDYRHGGIGKALLNAVPRPIRLKCAIDNPANGFYAAQGMALIGAEPGRKRALNIWEML